MRDPLNIDDLCSIKPDYIGFIFYPPSKRYVKDITDGEALTFIPKAIKRTGVFVNADAAEVKKAITEYKLNALQLHGNESPEYCMGLKNTGLEIIKAFHVDDSFDFNILNGFENCCDYFLFDTKTKDYGGSGMKFSWEILNQYTGNVPFFLSGGINPEDADEIRKIEHPAFYAVDINSKFEIEPGLKNINHVRSFCAKLLS